MKQIQDKDIRHKIVEVLKASKREFPNSSKDDLTIKQIDQMCGLMDEFRKNAQSASASRFQRELSIAYLSISALAVICFAMNGNGDSRPPISGTWLKIKGKLDPNLILQNMLVQVVNYSLAVVRLIEDGLDNPARCILRALDELSCQFLVLTSDPNILVKYVGMKKSAEAKQVWYELFARKGRLAKDIADLEKRLGLPEEFVAKLHAYREEIKDISTEAVHHSFTSTFILAYAGDFETEDLQLNMFGKAAPASNFTLPTLNTILLYTYLMFLRALVEVHEFKASRKSKLWREIYLWMECLRKTNASENGHQDYT